MQDGFPALHNFLFIFVLMLKRIYKIIFIAITLSFFISATEMNLGECHNTFFDAYDTYVRAEHVSFKNAISLSDEYSHFLALPFFINSSRIDFKLSSFNHPEVLNLHHYPPRLYLQNSVWRI